MSNQRETLISYISDLLDDIVVLPYNTHPKIIRGMEHWDETIELPAIIVDEGETEPAEDIAFRFKQATMDLIIIGRMRGSYEQANQLNEDIRKLLESRSNIYWGQVWLTSSQIQQDPDTDRKEVTMHYAIQYEYDLGSA